MGIQLPDLIALGLVVALAITVVVLDFFDYLGERDFNKKHHVNNR